MAGYDKSKERSGTESFVDPAQAGYLDSLRSGATNVLGSQPSYQPNFNQAAAGQNRLAGTQFADPYATLQPAADRFAGFNGANPYASQLAQYSADVAQPGGASVDQVIGNLGSDINRQLQRMLTGAGGVNTESALAGTLGGGRNQVNTGIAQEGALNQFATQSGQIRLADYQARRQEQLQRQALGQQALTSAGQLYGAGQGQNLAAIGGMANVGQAGLGAEVGQGSALGTILGQAQGLGQAPFSGQLSLWQQLAQVIGQPTVLQKGFTSNNADQFSLLQG